MKERFCGANGPAHSAALLALLKELPPQLPSRQMLRHLDCDELNEAIALKRDMAKRLLDGWPQQFAWIPECDREPYATDAAHSAAVDAMNGWRLPKPHRDGDGKIAAPLMAAARKSLRSLLCDALAARNAQKRGGGAQPLSLDETAAKDDDGGELTFKETLPVRTPPPCASIEGLLHLEGGDSLDAFMSNLAAADIDLAEFSPDELRVLWINWRGGLAMNASEIARAAGLSHTSCRRLMFSAVGKVRAQLDEKKICGEVSIRAFFPNCIVEDNARKEKAYDQH